MVLGLGQGRVGKTHSGPGPPATPGRLSLFPADPHPHAPNQMERENELEAL